MILKKVKQFFINWLPQYVYLNRHEPTIPDDNTLNLYILKKLLILQFYIFIHQII